MAAVKLGKIPKKRLIFLVLLVVGIYVVVPQISGFSSSWHLLGRPVWRWVLLAVALTGLTYLFAAGTYCFLAFRHLAYWRTVLVQFAALFVNRLLPAGSGAIGTNYAYLRRFKHSGVQAGSAVAMNTLLGFTGHWILVAITLFLLGAGTVSPKLSWHPSGGLVFAAILSFLIVAVAVTLHSRKKILPKLAEAKNQFLSYKHRLKRVGAALLSSMGLTLSNVGAFWCCCLAVGAHESFAAILLIFTFGVSAGVAASTPGGLGGFEAGLAAGLVAYEVNAPVAIAAALLYRLVSFWLPLAVGLPALIASQRKHLFLLKS